MSILNAGREKDVMFWSENISLNSASRKSNFNFLTTCFPQLNFPIKVDIDKSAEYRNATLKGSTEYEIKDEINYEDLVLEYAATFAGSILIITAVNEETFLQLIQTLGYKNNPVTLPKSMGASFLKGLNNWAKINVLKDKFLQNNPAGDWNKEFSTNIVPNTVLYKDQLIVLSTKPYSNVPAKILDLQEHEWRDQSLSIRKYHELTHYYTLQQYGCATNNLHDELIADYIGIVRTLGYFNKTWMLTFLGLENFPKYRAGARLENYLTSDNELDDEDFNTLIYIIKNAIENIFLFDIAIGNVKSEKELCSRIKVLCETDLLNICFENGSTTLLNKYNKLSN